MDKIIYECNNFIKDCQLAYAFCGGYALELFMGKRKRDHSDIDITLFAEDSINIINYILSKGWDIYEHVYDKDCLRKISSAARQNALDYFCIWAVKPGCSLIDIEPRAGETDCFDFKILSAEQKEFDFIEIIFNTQDGGKFICDREKDIARALDKAILYHEGIPYLAPEIILFLISNPAYLESDYHREKSNIDFSSIPQLLPKESLTWLISAIEKAYPGGNVRLEQLKAL